VTGALWALATPGGAVLPQGPDLTVFITADQNGEVQSCGCPQEDYGGLSRRAAFLDTLRDAGWDFLLLDGGDLTPFIDPVPYDREKATTVARAMALMAYDAVAFGEHDLAAGPDSARALAAWLGRPFLATNYEVPGTTERERVVTSRGRKVGLLAFMDASLVTGDWPAVETWESTRPRVKALHKKVDVLVALAHVPDSTAAMRLARIHPEIDLIVASHAGKFMSPATAVGKTWIVGAAGRGRWLTRVEIPVDQKGKPGTMLSRFLPVVESWGRRAEVDSLVHGYTAQVRRYLDAGD
jgi:2',3'-cyclic-nucleotide 2'-phosphodiesterase (5'-nucleotidase family)